MTNDKHAGMTWRMRIGFLLFAVSVGWPVLLPILPVLGVGTEAIAIFSGAMVVAAELLMLAGAAIAGKEGFGVIKQTVAGLLRKFGPPVEVSPLRYNLGLVIFFAVIIFGWASPYFGHHLPRYETHLIWYAVGGDLLLLVSLFLLGGAFWDKLRSLFDRNAHAVFPQEVT